MSSISARAFALGFSAIISVLLLALALGCGGTGRSSTPAANNPNPGATPPATPPPSGGSGGGTGGGSGGGGGVQPSAFVYVGNVGNAAGAGVSAWTVSSDGSLTPVTGSPFNGGGLGVVVDPSGHWVWSTDSVSDPNNPKGHVITFSVNGDGSLTQSSSLTDEPLTPGLFIDRSGQNLYANSPFAPGNYNWGYRIFSIGSNGTASFNSYITLFGGSNVAFTPADNFAYIPWGYHLDGRIAGYTHDSSGKLTESQTASLQGPFNQSTGRSSVPTWAAITPDGRYLAACFDNVQNATTFAIAVYSINASTGALTQVPNSPFTTIAQGNRLAFDPAGQWLAETTMNGLFIYKFDVGSGSLAVNSAVLGSGESDGLAFNKAGNLLFVTSKPANQLSVYKFNVGTGAATPAAGPYPTGQAPADIAIIQR